MSALPDRRSVLRAGLATAGTAALATAATTAAAGPAEARPFTLRPQDVSRWMTAYLKAWQTKDADGVVQLFTRDAIYQAVPGLPDQMFHGRQEIHDYWTSVTAPQAGMTYLQGTPLVNGNQADLEIWVYFQQPSETDGTLQWVTLIETNVLTFVSPALVSRNIEYNRILDGRVDPPAGWGRR
ncbi:nuclear transport factor 2 family protein [Kitasatospora sp. NPDC048365]|uniref:nuclear transport factor 2 family protein n=1 Tax=Kitasatospora sp. NPDC048365 TaxID=3364050 RepID=UPI003722ED67